MEQRKSDKANTENRAKARIEEVKKNLVCKMAQIFIVDWAWEVIRE